MKFHDFSMIQNFFSGFPGATGTLPATPAEAIGLILRVGQTVCWNISHLPDNQYDFMNIFQSH